MRLWIRLYEGGSFVDQIWSGTLTEAQDAYCQSVRDGSLDRLEIRDPTNELVFHYPLEAQLIDTAA